MVLTLSTGGFMTKTKKEKKHLKKSKINKSPLSKATGGKKPAEGFETKLLIT